MVRLSVRCDSASAERVLAELVELVPGGVEEDRAEGWVEYAIYGAPGELPELPDLSALAGDGEVEIATESIPDDWADRWRDFHRPVVIGDRIVVRPSWEVSSEQIDGPIEIVVDPGQAFGTGGHATTRMCLELLLDLEGDGEARGPLVDWGTGSGVLAIAAAKLGFDPVSGFDHEPAALAAAGANAAANGVTLELGRINLREQAGPVAPTAIANLTAPLLRSVAERIPEAPRRLICSGLLEREIDDVAAGFARLGLAECRRLRDGDWAALMLVAD